MCRGFRVSESALTMGNRWESPKTFRVRLKIETRMIKVASVGAPPYVRFR